jgi:hypothetical protein
LAQIVVGTTIDSWVWIMKTALSFPRELVTHIDVMNTLNGGASKPMVRVEKLADQHQITLRVPGISVDNITIDIKDNQLLIFYFTVIDSRGEELRFPRILYNKPIPYFVDTANINAVEAGDSLVLHLPFNDLANGYHREISIKK